MKVLFVEPPKDIWFVMGEYLPPPFGIIQLAAYLEREVKNAEIEVVDCNAEKMNWLELEKRIQFSNPDILASSSLATCNTYLAVRILQIAKNIDPGIITVAGGQHFTARAGTILYEEAKQNGWIEDTNWSNYDMIHAIMPTETLSRKELQEELYKCYRSFYGSWNRRMKGLFSGNALKRRIYWYMLGRGILRQLRTLYQTIPSETSLKKEINK